MQNIIESAAGPLLAIFYKATGSKAGSICLLMYIASSHQKLRRVLILSHRFPLICLLFATISIMTTSSRMTFAFARYVKFLRFTVDLLHILTRVLETADSQRVASSQKSTRSTKCHSTRSSSPQSWSSSLDASSSARPGRYSLTHSSSIVSNLPPQRFQRHHLRIRRSSRRFLCYPTSNQLPPRSEDAATATIRLTWSTWLDVQYARHCVRDCDDGTFPLPTHLTCHG